VDLPPPDPQKLLAHWNEWERGEVPPGQVMSNLKTGGLRTLLEQLVQGTITVTGTTEAAATGSAGPPAAERSGTGTGG
jgi:hypothetical protein